ncbi:MAG: ATP-binding protein [Rhodobacteraceae bacterium]|nr:ATP-binding protein [Paracoccaceae bacterium]
MSHNEGLLSLIRIADALERIAPKPQGHFDFEKTDAFIWCPNPQFLKPIDSINRINIDLLLGIERTKETLLSNTMNFAQGYSANNALLWGARGMGKSSLVKAVHKKVQNEVQTLKLVEIHREDLPTLDLLLDILRKTSYQFIVFCDDLSFAKEEHNYKTLKAALDGGVEGRPKNVIFYVTSNRRHLMPRDMIENERSTAINPSEAVEEKVSLSDRFGLWLGFHPCSQDQYLEMIRNYCDFFELKPNPDKLVKDAIEWQQTRGSRSGRVAWQFILNLAGVYQTNIEGILSKK